MLVRWAPCHSQIPETLNTEQHIVSFNFERMGLTTAHDPYQEDAILNSILGEEVEDDFGEDVEYESAEEGEMMEIDNGNSCEPFQPLGCGSNAIHVIACQIRIYGVSLLTLVRLMTLSRTFEVGAIHIQI